MTSTLSKYQIRLNLIDLMVDFIARTYKDDPAEEGQEDLLKLLAIYRTDTTRLMKGQHGSLEYRSESLKVGVRLAGELMGKIQETEGQSLIGWYHGVEPKNMVQHIYNVISETALELSWSILEIESCYPQYKAMFDDEREAYRRIHERWRTEDEADSLD